MSWKSEVTNASGIWIANRLRFANPDEAGDYVADLKNRCRWITATRVVECNGPATHRYINGELLKKLELMKSEDIES